MLHISMERDNYESNSIIGKYMSSCDIAEQPLSETQIGLLEKTINEAFDIKKNKSPPADVFKPLDKDALGTVAFNNSNAQTGRVTNILKKYRAQNLGISDDLPLSEADAWSLYRLTAQEIKKTTYKALKEKHNLPKTYGWTSFKILHEYFIERGILDKDANFPFPIDAY